MPSFQLDVPIKLLLSSEKKGEIMFFTITAEIHERLLVNFYGQYADRHEFEIPATRQRAKAGNSAICYRKNQIDASF